ncbi:MAG: type II secretion system protein GspM [Solirubrobacteraceae bacterium]
MTARDRTVLMIVLIVAAIAGTWLLVIQPKRDEAASLNSQIQSQQSQLTAARSQVIAGEAARSSYSASYTELARLGEAVPADDDVPSLIYQLQNAASATQVDFRNLVLNPGAGGGSTSSTSAAQSATAALPPGATVGPAGFPVEPFTFTFQGNFFHLASFFGRIERFVTATNRDVAVRGRLMTLNAISLGPGPQGFPQIDASISATTYLVPASQGVMAGGLPAGPSAPSRSVATQSSSLPAPTAAVTAPTR